MCSISGWVVLPEQIISLEKLEKINETLKHRGPDESGIKILNNVGLAHNRLSIIDLSDKGHQPMADASEVTWLVFNGEIYNYRTLKKELMSQKIVFNSATDTEVLLHTYLTRPDNFLSALNGMFALAIYDQQKKQLIIARDRYGEKPLYYSFKKAQHFQFASEWSGVYTGLDLNNFSADFIDPLSLACYLKTGFVPAPFTINSSIKSLPAGHWAILDTETLQWIQTPTPYWTIDTISCSNSKSQNFKNFKNIFHQVVQNRFQADVPVGVLLSGGLDSSSVAVASRNTLGKHETIHTFSVGYDCPSMDERDKAQCVSKHLNTIHHEVVCTPSIFLDTMNAVLNYMDVPVAEQLIPMYLVSKLAKEHVKVVLSGDGADELLGGYNSYGAVHAYQQYWSKLPFKKEILTSALPILKSVIKNNNLSRKLNRLLQMVLAQKEHQYLAYKYGDTLWERRDRLFYGSDFKSLLDDIPFEHLMGTVHLSGQSNFSGTNYIDLKTHMPESILTKSDRMSMKHGLELRCPFLDYNLSEFLLSQSFSTQLLPKKTKSILRQYLRQAGLPALIWNQDKAGFSAPFSYWLASNPVFYNKVHTLLFDLIDEQRHLKINYDFVEKLFQDHQSKLEDRSGDLWRLITLMAWIKRFDQFMLSDMGTVSNNCNLVTI